MPFFFNNENVEVIMEDNPDDIFTPSGVNQNPSKRKTPIRQLISQEITHTFEKYTEKSVVGNGQLCKADSLKEDIGLSYLFRFETDDEEYEITYHIPFTLATILEKYVQDRIDEERVVTNNEIFLNLSNSIVGCLNAQQDFAFLQDVKLIDLCPQTVDYEKVKILKNLYSFNISIDSKEYELYLQLDNQFNKTF